MTILSKRFIFATIAVLAVSATTIILSFDGDTYLKLVLSIVGIFMGSQTVTDHAKIKGTNSVNG